MEKIQGFKTSEKTVRLIEADNTIVLIADRSAKKPHIKKVFEEELKVKVQSVNTLIRDNKKYVYIRLKKEFPAIDVATKFNLI